MPTQFRILELVANILGMPLLEEELRLTPLHYVTT